MALRMLLAVLAAALLATGCGGDGDDAPAAAGADGATRGGGYAVVVPEGWEDATSRFEGSAVKIDRAWTAKEEHGVLVNLNVVRERPQGDVSLDDVEPVFRKQVSGLADGGIGETEETELDGEDAFTWTYRLDPSSGTRGGRQRQVVALRGGDLYTITYTGPDRGFDRHEETLRGILESWDWK